MDENEDKLYQNPLIREQQVLLRSFDYYLVGEIGEPLEYVDLCHLLRTATESDEVVIRINSDGGLVASGNQIINAIRESKAHVVGYIESSCGSMATMIFLACHSWYVSPSAEFFIHTSSGGCFGKESETFEHAMFTRKQTHKGIRQRYAGFLTETEIELVLKGTDLYIDADGVLTRLDNMTAYNRKAYQETPPTVGSC